MIPRKSERVVKCPRSYSPETQLSRRTPNKFSGNVLKNSRSAKDVRSCKVCKKPIKWKKTQNIFTEKNSISLCVNCKPVSLNRKKDPKIMEILSGKLQYENEAKLFAKSLVEVLHDTDADRLYCPAFKSEPCACLQKYILSDVNISQQRAVQLLQLLKESKRLSSLKFYTSDFQKTKMVTENEEVLRKAQGIGLGNGQKKGKQFEEFVLQQREYLRNEIKLCEKACQKVLFYSNNFLHKRLKTEPERIRRGKRKKGKSALGLLIPISSLASEVCCRNKCTYMAETHSTLIQNWRDRAALSQAESRKVLAEMLTPAGRISNCFKFVEKVTGCSQTTISKVNKHMIFNGGDHEPPEHGLKKWWQEQGNRAAIASSQNPNRIGSTKDNNSQLHILNSNLVKRKFTNDTFKRPIESVLIRNNQSSSSSLLNQTNNSVSLS